MPVGPYWILPAPSNKYYVKLAWNLTSRMTCAAVTACSKIWMDWFNKTTVHNRDRLLTAVDHRGVRGLITVSNHSSCIDDPLLWSSLKWRHVFSFNKLRWTPAALDVCFTNMIYAEFFTRGKVIPVVRGDGVYQLCMDFCVEQLDKRDWVHMFPEGQINLTKDYMRYKWGVGRLVADPQTTPIVLPIFHIGFDDVLPNKKPYIPLVRKKVTILVGSPMNFKDDVARLKGLKKTPMEIRKFITDAIQEEMRILRQHAEALHERTYGIKSAPT